MFVLRSMAEVSATEWDALLGQPNPFQRHAFLASLEDSGSLGAENGWQLSHRILKDDRGRLQAALPAYVKSHSQGEYVFDQAWARACHQAGLAYYPKLLAAVPFSPVAGPRLLGRGAVAGELLDAVCEGLPGEGLSGLHVNFTSEDDDTLLRDRDGWLERLGCQFHWFNPGYRDFQDFLDALTSRKRKQLRKERQQVQHAFQFEWRGGSTLSELDWDFVYACYASTYHVRGQQPYLQRAFFSLLAQRMADRVQVVLAKAGASKVLAMAFFLQDGDTLYGRYWGCLADFDRLHFETCFYQGMERAIAQGLRRFDAGAQGEHKLIRGFQPVITRSWHYLPHPALRRGVASYLEQERAAVLAYAQQATEALPYRHV